MAASIRCQIKLFCRTVCLSNKQHFSNSLSLHSYVDKSKTMRKIVNKANRKKDTNKLDVPIYSKKIETTVGMSGPMKSNRQFSEGMLRRARYLSEVMYEAVSQVIVCGELGLSPNITKVEVVPDCSHMNIYWEATGIKEKDQQTQIELDAKAKTLRHYLMQSHMHGSVPRPVFVADMHVARQRQVDELFRTIAIEDEKILSSTESASEVSLDENDLEEKLGVDSQFRQDLYGVPHDNIMRKIISAKSTASQRPTVTSQTVEDCDSGTTRINVKDAKKYFKLKKNRRNQRLEAERELFEIGADSLNTTWDKYEDNEYDSVYEEEYPLDQYLQPLQDDNDRRDG